MLVINTHPTRPVIRSRRKAIERAYGDRKAYGDIKGIPHRKGVRHSTLVQGIRQSTLAQGVRQSTLAQGAMQWVITIIEKEFLECVPGGEKPSIALSSIPFQRFGCNIVATDPYLAFLARHTI